MTVENARLIIMKELEECAALFEGTGVITDYDIEEEKNDTEDGIETVDLFGAISLSTEGASEDDALFLPLNAELDSSGNVIDGLLEESISLFRARAASCLERIKASDDIKSALSELTHEIDEDIEREYTERLARMDASTKKNLKIAIGATIALLAVAAICILIKRFF